MNKINVSQVGKTFFADMENHILKQIFFPKIFY